MREMKAKFLEFNRFFHKFDKIGNFGLFLPLDNVHQSFSVSTMVQLKRSRGLINMFF